MTYHEYYIYKYFYESYLIVGTLILGLGGLLSPVHVTGKIYNSLSKQPVISN
jgi:hypothetical protein